MNPATPLRALCLALLASTALAAGARAETLTVTDISVAGDGGFKLTVPSVVATDANLDEAEIRALFTETFANSAGRLATLNAAQIEIPEITVSYDIPDGAGGTAAGTMTYRNLEMTGVVDGVAERAVLGAIEIGGVEDMSITLGEMSTNGLDLGAILGFYGFGEPRAGTEMTPIYKDFVLEGGAITSPVLNCTIGSASAAEFRARPLQGTFADLMKYTAELEAAEAAGTVPSAEAIGAVIRYYADILTAFESSPTEFDGFNCTGTDPQGVEFTLSSGVSTFGAFRPGIYPALSFNDFHMAVTGQGWMTLGSFTWKETDLNGVFETLLAIDPADLNEAWFEANWRKIIPAFDGLSLSGLELDVPDMDRPGSRIVAGIGAFDVSLADYVNGIPATISTSGSNIRFAVPEGADGDALRALGIETLDLGFDVAARWNEAEKTISIEQIGLNGAGLGAIRLSGTIANAGPELFSPDVQVATVASTALTVTELNIEIENNGMVPLLIAAAATEEQMPPEAFRVTLAGMAQALPLAMLGATPDALGLSQSLGAFLEGAPNLTINLKSIDPRGIGLAELMAAEEDPAALKGKVAITASVSGEPVPFVFPELRQAPQPATPTPEPATPTPDATTPSAPAEPMSPRQQEKSTNKN
jgi:hypothetical protein